MFIFAALVYVYTYIYINPSLDGQRNNSYIPITRTLLCSVFARNNFRIPFVKYIKITLIIHRRKLLNIAKQITRTKQTRRGEQRNPRLLLNYTLRTRQKLKNRTTETPPVSSHLQKKKAAIFFALNVSPFVSDDPIYESPWALTHSGAVLYKAQSE